MLDDSRQVLLANSAYLAVENIGGHITQTIQALYSSTIHFTELSHKSDSVCIQMITDPTGHANLATLLSPPIDQFVA